MKKSPDKTWLFGFLLVAAVVLAYQQAWRAGYIWDDDFYVTENKLLTAADGLWRIWFSFDSPSQYFPLVYTTFRIEHALWGLSAPGYHWVNIILHGINAVLLWRLLSRLRIPGARLAAAIFALHPVQVESVAWITELKNVQMGFFFFLTLLAWVEFSDGRGRRAWCFYLLSLVLYALALFSKTTACTLPAALLLIAWLRRERIGWRKTMEVAPFVAMGIGMGLLTVWWERYHQGTQGRLFNMGALDRLLVASRAVWFYLGKLFWPADLIFSYSHWTISAADPLAWLWLIALCGLGWVAWYSRRFIGRSAFAALLFFVATLTPILGFFMLYTFRYTYVADHYQYLACIGPIALVSAGVERLREHSAKRYPLALPALCAVLLATLAVLTWRQCGMYRDEDTLWHTTIARNPASWMAYANLGERRLKQGRADEALAAFRVSLQMYPDREECYVNVGDAYLKLGDTEEAAAAYIKSIQINPDYPDGHYNLGVVLLTAGRNDEAIAQLRQAILLDPYHTGAHNDLGKAYFQKGMREQAMAEFRETLRLDPDHSEAHNNLGNALLVEGRSDEAMAEFRKALQIDPAYADAHYNMGTALLEKGQAAEAVPEYRAALQIDPNFAAAYGNLGLALLQQGQLGAAVGEFRAALRINPNYVEAHGNLGITLLRLGRVAEAVAEYREALRINPGDVPVHYNLGNALFSNGQAGDAIAEVQRANQLQPGSTAIENTLAWMLATAPDASLRSGTQALQLATAASQSDGGANPATLRTLAAAYAQAGEYSSAVQTAQQALQLAQAQSRTDLVKALSRETALYQAGRPYQEDH